MVFNSFGFIVFFVLTCLLLLFFERSRHLHDKTNLLLLTAGFFLYAMFDYRCLFILLLLIFFTYLIGLRVKNKKRYLRLGIVLDVLLLGFFKYFDFFVDSFVRIFSSGDRLTLGIIVPVGISFYVFKSISYLVDVYKGKSKAEKSLIDLALYLSFFPELVAGPISRAKDLLSQIRTERKLSADRFSEGLQLFVIGLFKKIVIAGNISVFVSEVYRAPRIYSSATVLLCVFAYSIEIYMDFAGYSDMAVGCAKMIGFDIENNFNLPYISRNVTEFWKRWHITLSSWLMDYIYIPLGGNRKGKKRQYLNLLITMAIGGLWHGADWTFVLWGIVNGLALIVHKIFRDHRPKKEGGILSIIITFIFISLTWILFRADSFTNAKDVFMQLIGFREGISYMNTWAFFGIAIVLAGNVYGCLRNERKVYYPLQDLYTVKGLFLFFLLVGLTVGLAYTGANPFIYAAF